ncbi:MAG: (Fe-S)-binding protein [Bacteroidales bacterium]|nr:(Fe-S)-binding protein [Bacteroidales bacterium]
MNVSVFIPCCIDQFSPQTGENLISLLERLGHIVEYNPNQTCCGRIVYDNGNLIEAKEIGEKFINDFSIRNYIVGCSTSCIGYVKNNMGKLFYNTSNHNLYKNINEKIIDITEFLVDITHSVDLGAYFPFKVSIHHNCHALNEYNLEEETKILLQNVRGLEIVSANTNNFCCGYGGMFATFNEPVSMALAKLKIEQVLSEGGEYIVSTDQACLLHLQTYIDKHKINLKTIHIVDLLSYTEADFNKNDQDNIPEYK